MKYVLVFISMMVFSSCSEGSDSFEAKAIGISDGDTLKVLTDRKEQIKIRLSGIDCPESHQAWGQNAKQALSDAVFGHRVRVVPVTTDRYGRMVATVYKGKHNINRYLVGSGNCHVYGRYAKDQQLFKLHDYAKSKNLGLWSMPENEIIEPWNFRRK